MRRISIHMNDCALIDHFTHFLYAFFNITVKRVERHFQFKNGYIRYRGHVSMFQGYGANERKISLPFRNLIWPLFLHIKSYIKWKNNKTTQKGYIPYIQIYRSRNGVYTIILYGYGFLLNTILCMMKESTQRNRRSEQQQESKRYFEVKVIS